MIDAIAIANYFVEKSKEDKQCEKLTLLRLVKYVYIAYGFALVLLGRSIINDRFLSHSQRMSYGSSPQIIMLSLHLRERILSLP